MKANLADIVRETAKNMQRDVMGISTGISELDEITLGLQKTELVIVAGRPSSGKSSMMIDLVLAAANAGHSLYVASIEMSVKLIVERMISNHAKVNLRSLKKGELDQDQKDQANQAVFDLEKKDIQIFNGSSSAEVILKDLADTTCDVAFIDYLQLLHSMRMENRSSELERIVNEFKQLAIKKDIAIVLLCQLNRQVEGRESHLPRLSDLRDSGGIEQTADQVWFIHRPDYYNIDKDVTSKDGGEAYILVSKNRNGPLGRVPVVWLAEQCSFKSINGRIRDSLYA